MQKYFVFLHKPETQAGYFIKPLADLINVSLAWAKTLLMCEIPYQRVATFDSAGEAKHLVKQLKQIGLKAVVLSYRDYKMPPHVISVNKINFDAKLTLETGGRSYALFPDYAKVIFKGRYHRWSERREIVRSMKSRFDLAIYSVEKEVLRRARTGFLLIYGASDSEVFEICERNFVCDNLAGERLLTSALRFARLCEMVKRFFKTAIWDERFWRVRIPPGRASRDTPGVAFIREANDRRQVLIASRITYRFLTEL